MEEVLRDAVRERAGHRCEYCHLPQAYAPVVRFHIEHIRARQHGGEDQLANLALACPHCNRCKGPNLTSVDPETATVVPRFHPRADLWDAHFVVEDVVIVGRTPIGRATVSLLRMNTDDRQKVRAALRDRGEWPT